MARSIRIRTYKTSAGAMRRALKLRALYPAREFSVATAPNAFRFCVYTSHNGRWVPCS